MINEKLSTRFLTFFVMCGCLGFTASTSPEAFPQVSVASMPVLAALLHEDKEGEDKK